jgi:hypothetical protein
MIRTNIVSIPMRDGVAGWGRLEAARRDTGALRLVRAMPAAKMRHGDARERVMREALGLRSFGGSQGRHPTRGEVGGVRVAHRFAAGPEIPDTPA